MLHIGPQKSASIDVVTTETASGRNQDRICEPDDRFSSTFRFGTGRSLTAEHIENMAKRTKRGRWVDPIPLSIFNDHGGSFATAVQAARS
jgi:hypothetical protein